jgi:PPOX class probable F420-dependent enzyme
LDPRADEFLKGTHFAKLATVLRDGSPQVTPVWYMYDGGKIFVNTAKDRVKYRNILRDDRVQLLVDEGYQYVLVKGRARVAAERDANKDIETLAVKYRGEAEGRRQARELYWKQERVTLEILPRKLILNLR